MKTFPISHRYENRNGLQILNLIPSPLWSKEAVPDKPSTQQKIQTHQK